MSLISKEQINWRISVFKKENICIKDKALYLHSQDLGLFPIPPATSYLTIVKLIPLTSQMKSNGSKEISDDFSTIWDSYSKSLIKQAVQTKLLINHTVPGTYNISACRMKRKQNNTVGKIIFNEKQNRETETPGTGFKIRNLHSVLEHGWFY